MRTRKRALDASTVDSGDVHNEVRASLQLKSYSPCSHCSLAAASPQAVALDMAEVL